MRFFKGKHKCGIQVDLSGGLGNQLFQFARGVALGIQTARPVVFSDHNYIYDPLRSYNLGFFNIQPGVGYQIHLKGGSLAFDLAEVCNCDGRILQENNFYFENYNINHQKQIIRGYWQSEEYFFSYRENIRSYISDFISLRSDRDHTALHFRLGDMASILEVREKHGLLETSYYTRALQLIPDKTRKVTYFSDSRELVNEAHINELRGIFKDLEFVEAQVIDEISDFGVLMSAKNVVIANSTFSWWGAYLNSSSFVVAPRNVFSGKTQREVNICDYYPKNFILI